MKKTKKALRRAAAGVALLSAAIPLSTGTANASGGFNVMIGSATADIYGCELTGESCEVSVGNLTDWATPVTVSVDGTLLGTITLPGSCCPGFTGVIWTPEKAGKHTLTAQQGIQTATLTVNIVDYNSLQGILKRYLGINTGS
ncbi:hypothetical protein [Nocardia aurantiaca]|uniref:Uncharacterized protein n=1 Tax=Nocardia aurantiaca TaxID=2675850 RepID=A0A6I3L7Z5_9NOCA|nr:hypothetical protein [Nocardia aurantiaca]MTE17528.1 hypothetical protein [Nocardia aurantiaca]